ncbi:hypothetical protein BG006_005320 [Podila minutissima]|uniref:Amino acid transporter n=1 Tax=Podila minutissima TaxID=64525 RepID=A0A9P5VRJ4_9FUNG|nr:hypothetical protein BG006_005320 [Podila minutissima]
MDPSIPRSPPLAYSPSRSEPTPPPEYEPSVSFNSYNEAVSFVQMYSPCTTMHSVELVKPRQSFLESLKRALAPLQAIAAAITVSSVMSGIVPLTQQELASGGPVMMVFGFAFAGLMAFTIALSLADISSGFPNVKGGLIEYSRRLAPPHLKRISSWVVGWLHFSAFVTGVTECAFSLALFATSAIEIATGVMPPRWVTVLIHVAVSIAFGFINAFKINIDMLSVAWHFAGPIVVLITIAASNKDPPSISWVFTHFENQTGFHNTLYVVLLGLVQGAFTMTGYDAPIHTAYNMPNAAWQVPQGIICGFLVSFFMGEVLILTLLFGIKGQDLASILNPVVTGNGVIEIFVHLISRAGTSCILVIFIGTLFFCGQGILKAVSEIGHELATKGAFPRSEYLAQVGPQGQPARVGWLCVGISSFTGMLYLGNTTLLGAMSSALAIEMNLVYTIPVALRLVYPNPSSFQPGPFSLGRFREPIAMVATWWSVTGTIIFSIPGVYPITPENMNYASVLLLATLGFILGYWYYSARHWFGLSAELDLNRKRISSAIELEQLGHAYSARYSVASKGDPGYDTELDEIENWLDNLERDLYRMK